VSRKPFNLLSLNCDVCTGPSGSWARGTYVDYPECSNLLQAACSNMHASLTVRGTAVAFRHSFADIYEAVWRPCSKKIILPKCEAWGIGEVIRTWESRSIRRIACHIVTLFTINLSWTELERTRTYTVRGRRLTTKAMSA
jgi:hypothetical protein